ncbi:MULTISPECIES: cytochrome P450 [Inquilinus]|uniref:Cytochrome P450 n=1 Tax=Inquilinus ginsengisoli TaxID=363840 RepID=A0ABU1JIZ0_9PROT|nr:cytochrome P450 [Inquilinus ginsengisoli]MDR6288293.1 cytochrome P450 [Inquilinus ginsengisoli]
MLPPRDPVAAITHPDPYPYYAGLLRRRPFHRDEALGLWVAASAETATAALASPAGRVRPLAEPVPRALLGGAAGEIFGRLVRMTDSDAQARAKRAIIATLASVTPEAAAIEARRWAGALTEGAALDPAGLDALIFALPMHVVGSLLGFAPAQLPAVADRMRAFVAAIAPGSSPEVVERGGAAAAEMVALTQDLIDTPDGGLARRLHEAAEREGGIDPAAVTANAVGFLSQTHDATAGLLGNAILALGARPELRRRAAADRTLLPGLVQEVLRFDPPAQNTRRFLAEDVEIAGHGLQAGDTVLVLLAAANRDPALNPDPDRFDLDRANRRMLTFGHGRHACPENGIANAIAVAGLDALLDRLPEAAWPGSPAGYRPSAARVPVFAKS